MLCMLVLLTDPTRMTIISPSTTALHSRMKKSITEKPMPTDTTVMGTPLYVPVSVSYK